MNKLGIWGLAIAIVGAFVIGVLFSVDTVTALKPLTEVLIANTEPIPVTGIVSAPQSNSLLEQILNAVQKNTSFGDGEQTLIKAHLLTGQVTCLDNSQQNINIQFNLDKKVPSSFGVFPISPYGIISGQGQIAFGLSTGTIIGNSFEVRGVVDSDSLCAGFTPAVITLTGQCGPGSTVNFATDSGATGTATGNIACV